MQIKKEKGIKEEAATQYTQVLTPPPFGFKKVKPDSLESPFEGFSLPSPEECNLAVELLGELHGIPTPGEQQMPVLDSLIRTILSQNTTDKNSRAAFISLKDAFPTWRLVYEAFGTGKVEESIKSGGLSEQKSKNIHNILHYLLYDHSNRCPNGEPSYEWLRDETTEFCKAEISKHKGVGPKTVACVLMFNMNRPEFPVDTHVWFICKKLGWVPQSASAETCYSHMNCRVPDQAKYPLHVLLVEHGKRCLKCNKGQLQLPSEGTCPLINFREKVSEYRSNGNRNPSPSSGTKKYVPWFVKTDGCEMIKSEKTENKSIYMCAQGDIKTEKMIPVQSSQSSVKVKAEKTEKTEIKTEKKSRGIKKKVEDNNNNEEDDFPLVPVAKKSKNSKILQHLDMQGGIGHEV